MNDAHAVFAELYRFQVDYWHEVDHNYGRAAPDFYTEDGLFVVGSERMAGRAEVAAFYAWRERLGTRTARHVVMNCRLTSFTTEEAEFECVMMLYADDGAPVLPSRPPIMIADVADRCVRQGGAWRFRSHVLTPIFQGGVAATVPTRSDLLAHKAGAR